MPSEAGPPDDRRRGSFHVEPRRRPAANRVACAAVNLGASAARERELEAHRAVRDADYVAARARIDAAAFAAVEKQLDVVCARRLEYVVDDDAARALVEDDPPAM